MTVFHPQQKHMSYPDVIINNSHVGTVDDFLNYVNLVLLSINYLKCNTHIVNTAIKVSKYIGIQCLYFNRCSAYSWT